MSQSPPSARLSMVSGNGVNSTPVPRPSLRSYRKMADIGVQCDSQEYCEPAFTNSTVAEINTSAEITDIDSTTQLDSSPTYNRPLSFESSSSSSSPESTERKKPIVNEELDVDAIVRENVEDELKADLTEEKTEPDGLMFQEKQDSSCALDCVSFTMHCCECIIL